MTAPWDLLGAELLRLYFWLVQSQTYAHTFNVPRSIGIRLSQVRRCALASGCFRAEPASCEIIHALSSILSNL
jgi:hypothetical protein